MPVDDAALYRMAQKLRRHSPRVHRGGRLRPSHELHVRAPSSSPCSSSTRCASTRATPAGSDADVFVLSKGHAAPILWAALKEAGAHPGRPAAPCAGTTARSRATPRRACPGCAWPPARSGRGSAPAAGMAWARKLDRQPGPRLRAAGRRRGGRGLGVGGRAVRGLLQARQPLRDRRREPPGPERAHHVPARHWRPTRRGCARFGWEAAAVDGHDVAAVRERLRPRARRPRASRSRSWPARSRARASPSWRTRRAGTASP